VNAAYAQHVAEVKRYRLLTHHIIGRQEIASSARESERYGGDDELERDAASG
jgi:hypothetical protein